MRLKLIFLGVLLLSFNALAQVTVQPVEVLYQSEPAKQPVLSTPTAPLRSGDSLEKQYPVGKSVTVFAGGNLFQTGKFNLREGYTGNNNKDNFDLKSGIGLVAGAKFGFTWSRWEDFVDVADFLAMFELDESSVGGEMRFMPALDVEFFYTGRKSKATETLNGTIEPQIDVYVISVNPLVKMQLGAFRPYVGMGIGGALISLSDATYNLNFDAIPASGKAGLVEDTDIAFAFQAIAGADWFFSRQWSLNVEYKYLSFIDPSFKGSGDVTKLEYEAFNHLLTTGIKYHF